MYSSWYDPAQILLGTFFICRSTSVTILEPIEKKVWLPLLVAFTLTDERHLIL